MLTTYAPGFMRLDPATVEEVVRVRVERHVQGDDVAPSQQVVERDVVDRGRRSAVVGQDPASEAAQPVDDGRADPTGPDDTDGQVAQLAPADVVQPVVMGLDAAQDGLRVAHRHQHQHQRVVGDAVGRVGDVLDRMPTLSAYSTSMWSSPTLRVEMYSTPARLSARRVGVIGVL